MEDILILALKSGSPIVMLFLLLCVVLWLVWKSWGRIVTELMSIIKLNTESNTKLIDTISSLNTIIMDNNNKIGEVEKSIQYCRIKNEGKING